MKNIFSSLLVIAIIGALLLPAGAAEYGKQQQAAREARTVLQQIKEMPEQTIPSALLDEAEGIVILPGLLRAGFVLGGHYGNGVLLVREDRHWSRPIFVNLVGGSFGWQIGASSSDVILVLMTPRSVEDIFHGKMTLGADAAIAAGPVGRRVEGATDLQLKAEIYSYSRSRGLFAGLTILGSSLSIDQMANSAFYAQEGVTPQEIVAGRPRHVPASAERLRQTVQEMTGKSIRGS